LAAPLGPLQGTLVCRGTPVENHWSRLLGRPHLDANLGGSLKEDESLENNPNVYDYEDSIEKLKKQKVKARIDQNLLPGVNFINVLCSAFTLVEPKSVKNTVKSSVSFMLSGSAGAKAVHRTLMKLSLAEPNVNIKKIVKHKKGNIYLFFIDLGYYPLNPENLFYTCVNPKIG